ncbi:MAG: PKD domain-containing protein [Candidatus Bipolaricaulis sp.]|nr:PKD domain-containing protein [Candidatus Bipolaricaulis sp.]
MAHRGFRRACVVLIALVLLFPGVISRGQSNEELLASLDDILSQLIALRQLLWDLETSIIAALSPDLFAFEALNFQYEGLILELTERFLAIRQAMHGVVPPLVIDEKIGLIKAELAAAWLENSMIEGKLSIKKRELLSQAVANDPPRGCFTAEPAFAGLPVQFVDCSSDLEGKIASWSWLFGDGAASDEASPTHVYEIPGPYDVSLVVTDEDGDVGRFSARIDVQQPFGSLRVLPDASLQAYLGDSPKTILVILDTSSSMEEPFEGGTRLAAGKQVLTTFLASAPQGVGIGLRIFGSCDRSSLVFPVQPLDVAGMTRSIVEIRAAGATPLALSLSLAASDLSGVPGAKAVLLISDGQESCGGDPVRSAEEVWAKISDLRIHVVGFEVKDDAAARQQLVRIAEAGRGLYVDVTSSSELTSALRLVTPISFRVVDASGAIVASGILGDPVPPLIPGVYDVEFDLPTGQTARASVRVLADGTATLRVYYSRGGYSVGAE